MKSILFALSVIFLIFASSYFSFSSNKTLYSCDFEVNLWMMDHIQEIDNYSLDDILKKEAHYYKAIFSALSPKSKARIFVITWDYCSRVKKVLPEKENFSSLKILN